MQRSSPLLFRRIRQGKPSLRPAVARAQWARATIAGIDLLRHPQAHAHGQCRGALVVLNPRILAQQPSTTQRNDASRGRADHWIRRRGGLGHTVFGSQILQLQPE